MPEPGTIEQAVERADVDAVLRGADLVHSAAAVAAAYDAMGQAITERLGGRRPVVVCVMLGGLVPTGQLIARLDFDLELDYAHATRYRGGTMGHDLVWRAEPASPLAGRSVLVVDDILDEGVTLAGVLARCRELGAAEVLSAVLVDKRHGRAKALPRADFTGLEVPDRYVFGCGMDYRRSFRNLPAIYALGESRE